MTRLKVERALVSVADKTGLVDLAGRLGGAGVEIVASGGTARTLADRGIPVVPVEEVTDAAEMLDGRVKTLHPAVHGAILADLANPVHQAELAERGIDPIQLVVVDLYPFEAAAAHRGITDSEVVEQIDIGGPALVRAAAKNHAWVGVVVDPDQYPEVLSAVEAGGLDEEMRRRLAAQAFFRTASYDAAIVEWFHRSEALPERVVLPLVRQSSLRYGENPHQPAAAYRQGSRHAWWADGTVVQGKAMSFNNHVDAEAAWRLACAFEEPAAVVVKHTNPSGAALGETLSEAFDKAWECDPLSAFGGVVGLNRPVDATTAEAVSRRFVEVVVAPAVSDEAVEILARKPDLRVITAGAADPAGLEWRPLEGGFVAQARDDAGAGTWRVVSRRQPSPEEMEELAFAWRVAAHTKSNAVVVARSGAAVGVGAGDQSRVGAAERALARAGERARGAVAASDAFFPFRDGLDVLAAAGVTAVVEPGGSRRDPEVIAAADEAGIALVFTDVRHFRH